CETDIDDCDPNPCDNGGTCVDGVNTFDCECLEGYGGDHCESDIDDCDPNPCDNGGACTDTGANAFECECPDGFTGETCEDIDTTPACDPADCDDANPCTRDDCSADTGECVNVAETMDGESCGDEGDICSEGVCVSGTVDPGTDPNVGGDGTDGTVGSGGCSTTPAAPGGRPVLWLVALMGVALLGRRRWVARH
ncbi:MAG: calcium-binding EGF-like domain-containing protein, partial [Myxococcota bacterium]|nr:calcium-binding EGF-like domain-containing protein [Myxococcota bacterium]